MEVSSWYCVCNIFGEAAVEIWNWALVPSWISTKYTSQFHVTCFHWQWWLMVAILLFWEFHLPFRFCVFHISTIHTSQTVLQVIALDKTTDTGQHSRGMYFISSNNPFTPESDQYQISPAASPEILHHTVRRTWIFIAYSDERRLQYKFSLPHLYIFSLKGWENVLFELRSERDNIIISSTFNTLVFMLSSQLFHAFQEDCNHRIIVISMKQDAQLNMPRQEKTKESC